MLDELFARCLPCGMTRRGVSDFMRDRRSQLRFVARELQQPGVDEEYPPGRVKALISSASISLNVTGKRDIGIADQILAQPVDVFGNDRVVDDLRLLRDFD